MCLIKCRPMGLLRYEVPPPYRRSPSAPNANVQIPTEDDGPGGSRKTSGDSTNSLQPHQKLKLHRVKRTDSGRSQGSANSHTSNQQYLSAESGAGDRSPVINININIPSPTEEQSKVYFPACQNDTEVTGTTKELDWNMVEKHYQLLEAHVDKTLSSDMPRLPDLKLVIIGSDSNNVVKSLLPGYQIDHSSSDDVCTRYNCQVTRENTWIPKVKGDLSRLQPIVKAVRQSYNEPIPVARREISDYSKVLQQVCQDTSELDSSQDAVNLEILAMSDTQLGMYCGHIHYTAHSVYIVQFSVNNFVMRKQSVLTDIQRQLVKIRTYASNTAQVLLVATTDASTTVTEKMMAAIGQSLHGTFSKAYGNQLDYNPGTNMPCYFLVSSVDAVTEVNKTNDLNGVAFNRQASCEDNTKEDGLHSNERVNHGSDSSHTNCNPPKTKGCQDMVWNPDDLKSRINSLVFQQSFVRRKYPYQFLVYREQIAKIRDKQPIGCQISDIMRECQVNGEDEQKALLKYLHNCGDIICMGKYVTLQHVSLYQYALVGCYS